LSRCPSSYVELVLQDHLAYELLTSTLTWISGRDADPMTLTVRESVAGECSEKDCGELHFAFRFLDFFDGRANPNGTGLAFFPLVFVAGFNGGSMT
jgi:hypothetical protein